MGAPDAVGRQWRDNRILFLLPAGFLYWAFFCVGLVVLPNTLERVYVDDGLWGFFFVLFLGIGNLWLVSIGVMRFIVCPLKIFVAWRVTLVGDFFDVRGFYRKRMHFLATEVASVKPYVLSRKQISPTMGTLLSQPQPYKEMTNWKVTLKSGVSFYVAAEMDKVEELKDLLGMFAQNNASAEP